MAYCMYLRKSRADVEAEGRGEGETLARHEKALLDLSARMRISIPEEAIYREIVSGETIAARPVMQRLLYEIEQGFWEGVLVMEVQRLARGDTIDQGIVAQTFKYSGTKIITPQKTYDPANEFDEEYFEFGLFMSRREYKTINRRLQLGREMSAREGKWVANVAPYGYMRVKLEREKGFTLAPIPNEERVHRLIFWWFTGPERLGVTRIRNRLNSMSIPTRKGGPWTDEAVRNILTNPVCIGMIRWYGRPQVKKMINGEMVRQRPRAKEPLLVPGRHPPITEESTFWLAQELLKANSTARVPSLRTLRNPLAGILICGVCGRTLVRRPYGTGYPDTLMCVGPGCTNVSSHLHLVEERLLLALEAWLEKYLLDVDEERDGEVQENPETEVRQQSIERLDAEIGALETQLGRLHDLLEQGVYTAEVFMSRQKSIKERLLAARANRKVLAEQSPRSLSHTESQQAFVPKVEKILELYRVLEAPAEKNALLKEVLKKVTYIKQHSDRGNPDAFELAIYPTLPH